MSMNSPAKQERIERHLMRQRGAGVRTVSANFGFCFGSSAPPSSEATPTQTEPPAKRRKTILHDVVHAAERIDDGKRDVQEVYCTKDTKPTKSRKRWALEEEEDISSRASAIDGVDSFIAGIEAKKSNKKKIKKPVVPPKTEDGIEATVAKPVARGRPKRRAAATAASKVADGFAEEAIPVDQKRRDAALESKPKTTRKKRVVASKIVSELVEANVENGKANGAEENSRVKQNSRKPKATKQAKQVKQDFDLTEIDQTGITKDATQAGLDKLENPMQHKRLSNELLTNPARTHEGSTTRAEDFSAQRVHLEHTKLITDTADPPKKNSRKKRTAVVAAKSLAPTKPSPDCSRQPLKETNMNMTIRSASPEKHSYSDEKVSKSTVKTKESLKLSAAMETAPARPSKRRRVEVRQDPHDRLEGEERTDAQKGAVAKKSSNSLENVQSTTGDSQPKQKENEEDLHWMFEPLQRKAPSIASGREKTANHAATNTRAKMPDIDLDELLQDIASLANKKDSSDGGGGRAMIGWGSAKTSGRRK